MSYPPPPGQPPYAQTWAAPSGPPPPRRSRTGLTIALLAVGLVLVLGVIGVVALVVRGDDSDGSDEPAGAGGGAHEASCEVYRDLVLNSEVWAATDLDPDKLQEMYDAALADITDDEVAGLVEEEATVTVSYYRALGEWKQSLDDALAQGEYPDTAIPDDITAQQGRIPESQAAVVEACQDVLPAGNDKPIPKITAPTLNTPSWLDDE
ncbi:hypothetical protein ACFFOS_26415 [Nocardioides kongjuensis]|uniref:Uncharacterized protein n=1 Tax=Nocardioides kongjuensis TaxID=349522 RepID=A0A852R8F1_9ACTN|nr:hypothetical protein [Nocardioides kongjuensis]NYD31173.1 hypothetical protein [Nocardioides kongjuensis]